MNTVRHPLRRRTQAGVSLISAIFLLVLFAALAGLFAVLGTGGQATSAQNIMGSKAAHGAQTGAEWGMFQLDPNGEGIGLPDCFAASTLPALAEFPGMTIAVNCTAFGPFTEGGRQIRLYRITATAGNGAAPPLGVERVVEVTLEKCRDPAITAPPYDC